ncbi:MAG: diguanylate cyclase [Sulfuricella sp.]|nr:diguanylate cyclase [Sulfuricella sp.]
MINVTSEELERILSTVEDALALHEKWRENLHRNLACKLPPESSDTREEAHQHCAFGRWFYSKGNAHLRNLRAFKEIGELHQAMHGHARAVCVRSEIMGKPTVKDYDLFVAGMAKFREALIGLQHRVSFTLQNIDALTGAYHHSKLLPDLKLEQQKLKESGESYSLLLLDIDLKAVNKSHGHKVGDQVLRTTIQSIRSTLTPKDRIYRYDGAEFVICLPGRNLSDAEAVRELLMKKIGEALVEATGEAASALNIHYGIIELSPEAYIEELLDRSARSTYTITI